MGMTPMYNKIINLCNDNPEDFVGELRKLYAELSAADDTLEEQEERLVDCE